MIHTDQGDISIANGASSGTLTIASGNGEDVYNDASSLSAQITGTAGGNFERSEERRVGEAGHAKDTMDATTDNLSASTVLAGAVAHSMYTGDLTSAV